MNLPPAMQRQIMKMAIPTLQDFMASMVEKANNVPLQEGEATHMIQLWVADNEPKIASVAVDETGKPVRKIFGPLPLNDYLSEDALSQIDLTQMP